MYQMFQKCHFQTIKLLRNVVPFYVTFIKNKEFNIKGDVNCLTYTLNDYIIKRH